MSTDSDNSSKKLPLSSELLENPPDAASDQRTTFTVTQLRDAVEAAVKKGQADALAEDQPVTQEMLFAQLLDNLPDHVYFKDRRSRFTCINRAQANFLGIDHPGDAIGKSDFDYFSDELATEQFKDEQKIMATAVGHQSREEKHRREGKPDRFILSTKMPLLNSAGQVSGSFGISRDITTRYLAEREVVRQKNLLETILDILPCRIFVRDKEDRFLLANETYKNVLGVGKAEELIGHKLSEFSSEERIAKILEEDSRIREDGEPILSRINHDLGVFSEDSWIVTSKVPLRAEDGEIEGVVGMIYDITEQKQAEEEAQRLSRELQLKNTQVEAELLVARQLQETLMSIGFDSGRSFVKDGPAWQLRARYFYRPSNHLAGDFFELIPVSQSKITILVCDVEGRGVKAALVTMLLRGLITEFASILDQPGQVLKHLNERLCSLAQDREFPRFTTAVCLALDLETGQAQIANAGHPAPLWKTRDASGYETFEPCPSGEAGPALGILPNHEFDCSTFACTEASEFLLYTSGVIEQKDSSGKEFGIPKLEQILLNNKNASLAAQLSTIESQLKRDAEIDSFDDDICLVALKMQPRAELHSPTNLG